MASVLRRTGLGASSAFLACPLVFTIFGACSKHPLLHFETLLDRWVCFTFLVWTSLGLNGVHSGSQTLAFQGVVSALTRVPGKPDELFLHQTGTCRLSVGIFNPTLAGTPAAAHNKQQHTRVAAKDQAEPSLGFHPNKHQQSKHGS
jgi:hypothetical protein